MPMARLTGQASVGLVLAAIAVAGALGALVLPAVRNTAVAR